MCSCDLGCVLACCFVLSCFGGLAYVCNVFHGTCRAVTEPLSKHGNPVFPHFGPLNQNLAGVRTRKGGYQDVHIWGAYRALCARCARAVRALCEKLAVLHHREFGKFRRLKGRY